MTEPVTPQTTTTKRWNFRKDVTLECPICGRRKTVATAKSDPPRTALVRSTCNDCPDDAAIIDYFDAYGNQIDDKGKPLA